MLLFRQGISTILETPIPDYGVYVWRMYAEDWAAGIGVVFEAAPAVRVDCKGFQVWIAGPYDSKGRYPIEGEWRYNTRMETLYYTIAYVPEDQKWYWIRCRYYTESGEVGNWWEDQEKRTAS